jgi:hypothetical protein
MGDQSGSRSSRARACFDFVFALALTLVPEHGFSRLKPREIGVISEQSRGLIGVALAQRRSAAHEGDECWNMAFATLAEVFRQEQYIDVRLYMYQLSDEAAALFCAYDQEYYGE